MLSGAVIEKSPREDNGQKGLLQNLKFLHIGVGWRREKTGGKKYSQHRVIISMI